jgi:hypothetical protein
MNILMISELHFNEDDNIAPSPHFRMGITAICERGEKLYSYHIMLYMEDDLNFFVENGRGIRIRQSQSTINDVFTYILQGKLNKLKAFIQQFCLN